LGAPRTRPRGTRDDHAAEAGSGDGRIGRWLAGPVGTLALKAAFALLGAAGAPAREGPPAGRCSPAPAAAGARSGVTRLRLEREVERRTVAGAAIRADPSVVAAHHPHRDVQPEPDAVFLRVASLFALEGAEQALGGVPVEADSVVAHEIHGHAPVLLAAHLDAAAIPA